MLPEDIVRAVSEAITGAEVTAHLEGNHAHLQVISAAFEGLLPVKRQQLVYTALQHAIASGAIHAVHMKCYTPAQWARQQG